MTTQELLKELENLDITYRCDEGELCIDAPEEALTPELFAVLEEQTNAVLALLSETSSTSNETQQAKLSPTAEEIPATTQPHANPARSTKHPQDTPTSPSEPQPLIQCIDPATFVHDVTTLATHLWHTQITRLALSLQTTGPDPHADKIISITIGTPQRIEVLDMRPYYELPDREQIYWKGTLALLLQAPGMTWIGHDFKSTWSFLNIQFGIRLHLVTDTMLADQLLYGTGRLGGKITLSLQATAQRYGLLVSQEQQHWLAGLHRRPVEWSAPFTMEQVAFLAQEATVLYHIAERQQPLLEQDALVPVAHLENEALPAIAAIEVHGALVDQTRWKQVLARKRARKEVCEHDLIDLFGMTPDQPEPINLSSTEQLIRGLARLDIQVTSTREEVLEAYAHVPVVARLLEWRKLAHFCNAFGENILAYVQADGRIHANFQQIGTVTGRIVCSHPNLQQIPKRRIEEVAAEDLRQCFVAPPGHRLLKADLSNIELRILAEISQDATMLRLFAEGKDLHAETARLMFHLEPQIDTRQHLYKGVAVREIAKTINFGLSYGMGVQGMTNRLGVSLDEGQKLMEIYFATYTGVVSWLRRTSQEALKQGYATTRAGRKRFFNVAGANKSQQAALVRMAKNHPIQGTNADILKQALVTLYRTLPAPVKIILVVHDEIVLECPEELLEQVTPLLKRAMVQACRCYLNVVSIPEPDVLVGTYWQKD